MMQHSKHNLCQGNCFLQLEAHELFHPKHQGKYKKPNNKTWEFGSLCRTTNLTTGFLRVNCPITRHKLQLQFKFTGCTRLFYNTSFLCQSPNLKTLVLWNTSLRQSVFYLCLSLRSVLFLSLSKLFVPGLCNVFHYLVISKYNVLCLTSLAVIFSLLHETACDLK